ncbi:MAG: ABC transporter substrate-binding protein [Nitriliruptorales bacterium]|nr:ABC transporter substrate-binding protein [Nitriliruptorales bacterium]
MQRSLWLRRFAVLMVFGLLAAACGGDDDPDTTDTETGTPTETEMTETETETDTETETEGQATGANVDGTLKIGTLLPQTGALAQFGPGMQFGVELAVQQINEAGGVLGGDVELVTADSGTDPQVANDAVDGLLQSDNVDAIVGAASSDITKAVIEKVISAEVAECSPSNTGPDFTTFEDEDPGFYFRTAPSDALQGQVLGNLVLADGFQNVGLVYRNEAYGQGLANQVKETIENGGGTVAVEVPYDPRSTGPFDAEAEQLAQADLDAVVSVMFIDDGAAMINAAIEKGVGPGDVQWYGADGTASDDFPEAVSEENPTILDGMKGTAPDFSSQSEAFSSAFDEGAPENAQNTFAPQAYDCAIIIALAAQIAGSDDPNDFMQEVVGVTKDGEKCDSFAACKELIDGGTTDIDYDGASGSLSFAPPGEPAAGTYTIYQFTDGDVENLRQESVG